MQKKKKPVNKFHWINFKKEQQTIASEFSDLNLKREHRTGPVSWKPRGAHGWTASCRSKNSNQGEAARFTLSRYLLCLLWKLPWEHLSRVTTKNYKCNCITFRICTYHANSFSEEWNWCLFTGEVSWEFWILLSSPKSLHRSLFIMDFGLSHLPVMCKNSSKDELTETHSNKVCHKIE